MERRRAHGLRACGLSPHRRPARGGDEPGTADGRRDDGRGSAGVRRIGAALSDSRARALRVGGLRSRAEGVGSAGLAAALTLYAAFNAGGYFADAYGVIAVALLL